MPRYLDGMPLQKIEGRHVVEGEHMFRLACGHWVHVSPGGNSKKQKSAYCTKCPKVSIEDHYSP